MAARESGRREASREPEGDEVNEGQRVRDPEPDVLLDIPVLNVEELDLEVEDLRAHVSARAELADFVKINVGVDAYLNNVKLGIKGVEAQAQLKVRLERILGTLERGLAAIEQHPGLLDSAFRDEDEDRNTQAVAELEAPQGAPQEEASAEQAADEDQTAAGTREPDATEAARRKAEELGVDLSGVEGSGAGGRVLVRDVAKAAG